MKKAMTVLLIATLVLFSVSTSHAAENNSIEPENKTDNITERFEQWAADEYQAKLYKDDDSYMGGGIGYYEPEVKYCHFDDDGNMDWALIEVYSFPDLDWEIAMRLDDLIIDCGSEEAIFCFGYGIYDANQDTFYDIYDVRERSEDYPDLKNVLSAFNIGRPIGDADADSIMTVLDATRVQRVLAELESFEYNGAVYYLHEPGQPILDSTYYADYDLDGTVTIVDATGIQRALVGYGNE